MVAEVLLKHGSQVDLKTKVFITTINALPEFHSICTQNGWTAMHIATQEGHYDFVELLIKHNARVNLKTQVTLLQQFNMFVLKQSSTE